MKKKRWSGRFLLLALFGLPMGFMEAAVVVYLRAIYYPGGFRFPMAIAFDPAILSLELGRELSTLVILLAVAGVAGRNFIQRFSYFLYSFAVWDISYYAFLKAAVGWPESLLTWDVLFLIPWAWDAPVLAPLITSLSFMVMALCLTYLDKRRGLSRIPAIGWCSFTGGVLLIILTFTWDIGRIVIGGGFLGRYPVLATDEQFLEAVSVFVPGYFNWPLFAVGEVLMFVLVVAAAGTARSIPSR